jgi:L-ribulose-5-phosphate 3-epimerase
MKKGLYQGCLPPTVSMEQSLKLIAELGFDGLEITMEDLDPLPPEAINETTPEILAIGDSVGMTKAREGALTFQSSPAEIDQLAVLVSDSGSRIHSIASMAHFFYPLSSPVPSIRDRGIEMAFRMLEAAHIVGADTILLVPGFVTPAVGYQDVYQTSQRVIRGLAKKARQLDITIAIENVWNRFLLSPLEMARYVDELDTPYVGVYFDVANVLPYGYAEDWLRILGTRVKAVHFKDFRRDIDNILGFTHLLHGDVNWPAVSKALDDIGYAGYVTVEVPPLRTHPLKGVRDAMSSLRLILEDAAND